MPNYAKLDLSAFKKKLKNGEYQNLTGAKRAIGKMAGWTDEERDKARGTAARHFGETLTKTPAKPAKKDKPATTGDSETPQSALTKKKAGAAQRGQVKVSKTQSKKVVKKSTAGAYGPGKGRMPKATKQVQAKKTTKKGARKVASAQPTSHIEQALSTNRAALELHREAVETIRLCEGPGVEIGGSLNAALQGITTIVENLRSSVVEPLSQQERMGAELFAKAAAGAVTPEHPVAYAAPGNGTPQQVAPVAPPPGIVPVAPPPGYPVG